MTNINEPDAVTAAAAALHDALETTQPIAPVVDALGAGNTDAAYAVQERLIGALEAWGAVRVGRKVGLTNPAVQQQLGVDEPDFGVLLDTMEVPDQGAVSVTELIAPRIEAEIAFIMRDDVDAVDRTSVVAAVECAVAAFEIVDSRVSDWDISIVDTIADNASSARYVLGDSRVPLGELDTVAAEMTLSRDGEVVSTGSGQACLGDPLTALVWVAETAKRLGRPLRAGEVVLSGALGPMIPLAPGHTYEAHITGLGSVRVTAEEGAA